MINLTFYEFIKIGPLDFILKECAKREQAFKKRILSYYFNVL